MNSHFEYLSDLGPLEFAGVCGFLVYFLAFSSVQFSLLNGNSAAYSLLNVVAASLVSVSLMAEFNLSSALIQTSWIAIGLIGLTLRGLRSLKPAFTAPISVPSKEAN